MRLSSLLINGSMAAAPSSCRNQVRLLAISLLLTTKNISLVLGFQSLSQSSFTFAVRHHHSTPNRQHELRKVFRSIQALVGFRGDEVPSENPKESDEEEALSLIRAGPYESNGNRTESALEARKKLGLMWCTDNFCKDAMRERVTGDHNQIILDGPATGQVAYYWQPDNSPASPPQSEGKGRRKRTIPESEPSLLLLVKPNDNDLIACAAKAVEELTSDANGIHVSVDSSLAGKLKYSYGVDNGRIHLFEARGAEGFGGSHVDADDKVVLKDFSGLAEKDYNPPYDLICTLGGDGLLMHASMLFQGPVPPVISIAGGSLGFLTQFSRDEMVDAVRIALGVTKKELKIANPPGGSYPESGDYGMDNVFPPNMPSYPYEPIQKPGQAEKPRFSFGLGDRICLSIRMRLDCRIFNPEGVCRARFNVLNEVVIDRGSSPYLAALECFCDDVHLTTVQADGVIFATPTGSTAYSMAAGGSVVHPAVPCILVTPICPHVLSFRSMVFPDHVVLRCYVPDDARSDAAVAFDGRYRRELRRGDSLQIQMSSFPVPTLNRADHSSDWLGSLKRSFNFNTRPRQKPLEPPSNE